MIGRQGQVRSDKVLEGLQRHDLDHLAGRLGLDHDRLLGGRVEPGTGLGGRLVHHLDLVEAGDREDSGTLLAQLLAVQLVEGFED